MIFFLGIISALCGVSFYFNFDLLRRCKSLQNKEKEMLENLNSYTGLEEAFIKEKQYIEDKYSQILKEKEKHIQEAREYFLNQSKEIKQENEKRLIQQRLDYDQVIKKLESSARETFANVAQVVLEQKGKVLHEQSVQNINHILAPFKADITNFKQLIHTVESQRTQQHAALETQIKNMQNYEKEMMQTAVNLTNALKADSKTQGNWGEMIVRKILESAGLKEGEHYIEQGRGLGLTNEDGKREQPDFIINLPNNKHIVLDSKVSLTAYERFCADQNDGDLKAFLASIKNHISQLSEKKYHENSQLNTPDFTMMFIPIEGAYFLAVQHDREIYDMAWKKRIALCCPSTLFAMLHTISHLWQIDMRNKNAEKIATRAMQIYKKFEGFIQDLQKIGSGLQNANKAFEEAEKKFTSGRGSLDSQFRDMQSLIKISASSEIET